MCDSDSDSSEGGQKFNKSALEKLFETLTSKDEDKKRKGAGKSSKNKNKGSKNKMAQVIISGSINALQDGEDLAEWLERFDMLMNANKIDNEDKVNWLSIFGGQLIHKRMKMVCAPKQPLEVEYATICAKMKGMAKANDMSELARAAFYSRVQQPGENVSEFAVAVKELAAECNFGETFLDPTMRDRFMYNLSDNFVRMNTIKAKKVTFEEAVKEALMQEISNPNISVEINRFTLGKSRKVVVDNPSGRHHSDGSNRFYRNSYGGRSRYRGGRSRHDSGRRFNNSRSSSRDGDKSKECPTCARERHGPGISCPAVRDKWVCHRCRKVGHARAACRSKMERYGAYGVEEDCYSDEGEADNLHHLRVERGEYEYVSAFDNFLSCEVQTKPPLTVNLKINGISINCELDSGACVTVFSYEQYNTFFKKNVVLEPFDGNKKFCTADGHSCTVRGVITLCVNGVHNLQALVIDSRRRTKPLIGRTWLDVLCIGWRDYFSKTFHVANDKQNDSGQSTIPNDVNQIHSKRIQSVIEAVKREFRSVFDSSNEPIKNFKASFRLKDGSKPIFLRQLHLHTL